VSRPDAPHPLFDGFVAAAKVMSMAKVTTAIDSSIHNPVN
jgi:hypothetical protein